MAEAQMNVGFIGLGIMGTAMARNLIKSKQFKSVMIWNRTLSKTAELAGEGALVGKTIAEVITHSDITFAVLGDPDAAIEAVFGETGVLSAITAGKGYVDMSTVDEQTSTRIATAVTAKGGLFLEGPVSGSKGPAINGQLVIMAAGDESLFAASQPAFALMGKRSFYLGATGAGARMKLVVNMVMGSMMGAFTEGLALAGKAGLDQTQLLEILSLGAIANPMFALKGPAIVAQTYAPAFPLKHQQKDMRLALALGADLGQALPVAAAANEIYKEAVAMGHGDDDFSAVFEATVKH
ncbi:MAG: hypothetical protein WDW36_004598 [Sanguina aurantia]